MRTQFSSLIYIFLAAMLTQAPATGQSVSAYDEIKSAFLAPPQAARPKVYWWWLTGNVDTLRMKEEIAAMERAGLSGFDIFETGVPPTETMIEAGPAFLGEQSLDAIRIALEEAKKRNMEVGLNLASSWNAGGTWISPEHSAKSIYFSKSEVRGKPGGKISLPFPEISKIDAAGKTRVIKYGKDGKPVFYREVAVVAVPVVNGEPQWDPTKIVDVSADFDPKTEKLNWSRAGDWDVHRFICSNSGEQLKRPSKFSAGPIIDHFDSEATEAHFLYIISQLKEEMGDLAHTALKSLYLASYEATGFVWTTTLPKVFEELNGYEVNTYLPVLFNQEAFSTEVADQFLNDYKRTLSELMITNFYKKAREICQAHGLKINSEAGGPGLPMHNVPAEPLKALGSLDLPRGEFWINYNAYNDDGIDFLRVVKEVSSASHIYGRGVVEEESFTSSLNWQEGPFDMKPTGDRAFCEGMNRVVIHGFSHNPEGIGYPGIVYHAGTHFNDKRVWHSKIRPFTDYLARVSAVFQKTDFVADVLYYYGDAIPNYAGPKNGRFIPGEGYDYEVINTEILLQLQVKDGKLILPTGASFAVLALENEPDINPQVLVKVKQLVDDGAIILGEKPEGISERPGKTSKMAGLPDGLWNQSAKRHVISGQSASEVLQSKGVRPDIWYHDIALHPLDFIHYSKNEVDVYFLRNTGDTWINREVAFRQTGKVPEVWSPVEGTVAAVPVYDMGTDLVELPVSLPPRGSIFIIFRPGSSQVLFKKITTREAVPPRLHYTEKGLFVMENGQLTLETENGLVSTMHQQHLQSLDGHWEVFFDTAWGGPEKVVFPNLISWTDAGNEAIKYYSGNARYRKPFYYDKNDNSLQGRRVFLDLGDLSKVAEVTLNGEKIGIVWAQPYRLDITDYLIAGNNVLEVEVANVWANRIIGDALTEGKDYTFTNMKTTTIEGFGRERFSWEETPLVKSGLLGPVNLITVSPISAQTKSGGTKNLTK